MKRFWDKVDKSGENGCWNWIGAKQRKIGYGSFGYNGKIILAHRFSFILSGGIITPEKPFVLHHCDNRLCVNPLHLYAGTRRDNANDMIRRGRHHKVNKENNPNWKGGKIKKYCEECGKEYHVIFCRKNKARFCSMKCANNFQSKHPYTGRRKKRHD